MTEITFPLAAVLAEIEKCRSSKRHLKYFGQDTGPVLWLIGDSGIYLMGNQDRRDETVPYDVVYSLESNPNTMEFEQWYQAKNDLYGRDDGCDVFEIPSILALIGDPYGKDVFKITLDQNYFTINIT